MAGQMQTLWDASSFQRLPPTYSGLKPSRSVSPLGDIQLSPELQGDYQLALILPSDSTYCMALNSLLQNFFKNLRPSKKNNMYVSNFVCRIIIYSPNCLKTIPLLLQSNLTMNQNVITLQLCPFFEGEIVYLTAGVFFFASWQCANQIHFIINPHQNDQGRKGPCYFQRLNALKCLKCQKI